MVGALQVEEKYVCRVDTIGKHAKEDELDGTETTQVEPGLNCSSMPKGEVAYLKRTVRSRHRAKDISKEETMKKAA